MGKLNISNQIKILNDNPPHHQTVPVYSIWAFYFCKFNPKIKVKAQDITYKSLEKLILKFEISQQQNLKSKK